MGPHHGRAWFRQCTSTFSNSSALALHSASRTSICNNLASKTPDAPEPLAARQGSVSLAHILSHCCEGTVTRCNLGSKWSPEERSPTSQGGTIGQPSIEAVRSAKVRHSADHLAIRSPCRVLHRDNTFKPPAATFFPSQHHDQEQQHLSHAFGQAAAPRTSFHTQHITSPVQSAGAVPSADAVAHPGANDARSRLIRIIISSSSSSPSNRLHSARQAFRLNPLSPPFLRRRSRSCSSSRRRPCSLLNRFLRPQWPQLVRPPTSSGQLDFDARSSTPTKIERRDGRSQAHLSQHVRGSDRRSLHCRSNVGRAFLLGGPARHCLARRRLHASRSQPYGASPNGSQRPFVQLPTDQAGQFDSFFSTNHGQDGASDAFDSAAAILDDAGYSRITEIKSDPDLEVAALTRADGDNDVAGPSSTHNGNRSGSISAASTSAAASKDGIPPRRRTRRRQNISCDNAAPRSEDATSNCVLTPTATTYRNPLRATTRSRCRRATRATSARCPTPVKRAAPLRAATSSSVPIVSGEASSAPPTLPTRFARASSQRRPQGRTRSAGRKKRAIADDTSETGMRSKSISSDGSSPDSHNQEAREQLLKTFQNRDESQMRYDRAERPLCSTRRLVAPHHQPHASLRAHRRTQRQPLAIESLLAVTNRRRPWRVHQERHRSRRARSLPKALGLLARRRPLRAKGTPAEPLLPRLWARSPRWRDGESGAKNRNTIPKPHPSLAAADPRRRHQRSSPTSSRTSWVWVQEAGAGPSAT